jgi:hypothetical protein
VPQTKSQQESARILAFGAMAISATRRHINGDLRTWSFLQVAWQAVASVPSIAMAATHNLMRCGFQALHLYICNVSQLDDVSIMRADQPVARTTYGGMPSRQKYHETKTGYLSLLGLSQQKQFVMQRN